MDFRHLFDPNESHGAYRPSLNLKLELQQLRTSRRELADKWMLECVHYHSQIKEIQKREEELLDELLRYKSEDPEASSSMQYKAESPTIPSTSIASREDSTALFANWQLQQFLDVVGNTPGTVLGSSAHPTYDASREATDAETMILSGSSKMQSTSGPIVACLESSKRPSTCAGDAAKIKKKRLDGISFEQLREHVANVANACDESTGEFKCPVCGRVKKESKYNSIRHLLEHLNEKEYHPYKCPVEGCATTSVRSDVVRAHVVNVHKLEWTDELKAASADAEKKAVLGSMLKERK